MTHDYKKALEVIKQHNEWRRGAEIDMTDPKLLGVALDTAIHALELAAKCHDMKPEDINFASSMTHALSFLNNQGRDVV